MSIYDDERQRAKDHPETVGVVMKRFEMGAPMVFHVLAPYELGEGEEWVERPAMTYMPIDFTMSTWKSCEAAKERIHRSVGQRARFEKRWVRELVAYHRRKLAQ